MSILGSLVVSLTAETVSFVSGMTGAAKTAKTAGRDIESAFSQLGSIAETALAPFGELGAAVGETLDKMGTSAGRVIETFGRLGGPVGLTAGIVAGGAAAVLAFEAGAIGLAIHTAEAAAKLGEMAEKAGVGTRAFAGLSVAGKAVGVDNETLAKALGFLNVNAVKAAVATDFTTTSFGRLGIQVRNAGGGMRDTSDIFLDVVSKIAGLPTTEQGFFAKQIFGKGGLAVLPLINEGVDKIREKMELAKSFGLGDPEAIASSRKFKETIEEFKDQLEGAALNLTGKLLPALQFVADKISTAFKTGDLQAFIDKVVALIRETAVLGYELAHIGDVNIFGKPKAVLTEFLGTLEVGIEKAQDKFVGATGEFSGASAEELAQFHKEKADNIAFYWKDTADKVNKNLSGITWSQFKSDVDNFQKGLEGPGKGPMDWADHILNGFRKPKASGGDELNKKEPHRDFIEETIGKLRAQTAEDAALANAISDVTANTIVATAAAQAEKSIIEANTKAKQQHKQVTGAQATEIRSLALADNAYKEATKDNKGLEDFIQKTQLQTKSLQALGAAYASNLPVAIEQAREMEKTAPFAKQITDIEGVIQALRKAGASDSVLAPLLSSLAQLQQKFAMAKVAVHDLFVAEDTDKWGKAIRDLAAQKAQIDSFIPTALQGAAALREFNIEQQTEKFARDNPALSQQQVNEYRASLRALEQDKVAMAAADKVAASQSFLATQLQISDLTLLRQKEVQAGQDTTATDLLIYQTKTKALTDYLEYYFQAQNAQLLGAAKLFDVQQQLIKQWDEATFKVGTFSNRVKAVFNEISIQGKLAGSQIAQAFVSAFDSAEGQLAHLIVTGKANFLNVLQTLEEAIIKAGIQKAIGGLIGGIGGKPPGLTPGAQLGSAPTNPLYVFAVNAGAGLGGGSTNLPFEAGGAPTAIPGVVGAVGGESLGLPTGIFTQQLNTMAAAQAVFAGKMGGSWTGIVGMFRGAIGLMMGLFHIHTAGMIAGQAAQTGAAVASQAAQTGAATAGAGARSNIGFMEHMKKIFHHASDAAAGAYSSVFDSGIPFPINAILAPVAAAGAFAGVLAWGAIGSAARGALVPEDMLMMTHKNEMVIPGDISEGLQGIIRANQGGFAPSVSDFGGPQRGGAGDEFHAHVHMGDVNAWDAATGADQLKRLGPQMGKQIKQMFKTGYLNPRKLARV